MIVPLVAAHLSNGGTLVRVVVPKPLVPQMFQLLTLRLSGLAQQRIYYMPVSRSMNIDVNQLHDLRMLWEECTRCRSVLIAQPEHILSFKLMVMDHSLAIPGLIALARSLLDSAIWLRSHSISFQGHTGRE